MSTLTIAIPAEFDTKVREIKEELNLTTSELRVKHLKEAFPNDPSATISALLKQWRQENKETGKGIKERMDALKADSECLQAIREMVSDFNAEPHNYDAECLLATVYSICTEGLSDAPTEAN